jgi:hypothetical protein
MKTQPDGINRPMCYTLLLQWLSDAANKCGYALGLHGSMNRDLDLIAAPWTDDAVSADQLISRLTETAGGFISNDLLCVNPEYRPHGRMAYAIQLGRGLYLDISVMPRKGDAQVSMFRTKEEIQFTSAPTSPMEVGEPESLPPPAGGLLR